MTSKMTAAEALVLRKQRVAQFADQMEAVFKANDQSQGRGLVLDEIQTLLRGLHQLEADQKQRLKEGGTP